MELWNIEHKVHEEMYFEPVEFGGIDSGNEVFQVFADPFENKSGECGEDGACERRQAYLVGTGSRGSESDLKQLETGQRGQTSGHCVG